jgi:hypothetical protein
VEQEEARRLLEATLRRLTEQADGLIRENGS